MRLLLDTHIFLWATGDDKRLKKRARDLIRDAEDVYVSAASIWEAGIKASLGKLDAEIDMLVSAIAGSGFSEMPVRAFHIIELKSLPHLHRDPFDRLLLAQASDKSLRLVTVDRQLAQYSKHVLLV